MDSGRHAVGQAIERYGNDFSSDKTVLFSDQKRVQGTRDDNAEQSADRMIQKFNRRLPDMIRNQVFISYSHKDQNWRERFQVALKPLVRNQSFAVWDDQKIKPGTKWQENIDKALNETRWHCYW